MVQHAPQPSMLKLLVKQINSTKYTEDYKHKTFITHKMPKDKTTDYMI